MLKPVTGNRIFALPRPVVVLDEGLGLGNRLQTAHPPLAVRFCRGGSRTLYSVGFRAAESIRIVRPGHLVPRRVTHHGHRFRLDTSKRTFAIRITPWRSNSLFCPHLSAGIRTPSQETRIRQAGFALIARGALWYSQQGSLRMGQSCSCPGL